MSEPLDIQKSAQYVLFQLHGDHRGEQPGGFYQKLIEAAVHADIENRQSLGWGFPQLILCITTYKDHPDGIPLLEMWAGFTDKEPDGSHLDQR